MGFSVDCRPDRHPARYSEEGDRYTRVLFSDPRTHLAGEVLGGSGSGVPVDRKSGLSEVLIVQASTYSLERKSNGIAGNTGSSKR
jgi:hypothetical protein